MFDLHKPLVAHTTRGLCCTSLPAVKKSVPSNCLTFKNELQFIAQLLCPETSLYSNMKGMIRCSPLQACRQQHPAMAVKNEIHLPHERATRTELSQVSRWVSSSNHTSVPHRTQRDSRTCVLPSDTSLSFHDFLFFVRLS